MGIMEKKMETIIMGYIGYRIVALSAKTIPCPLAPQEPVSRTRCSSQRPALAPGGSFRSGRASGRLKRRKVFRKGFRFEVLNTGSSKLSSFQNKLQNMRIPSRMGFLKIGACLARQLYTGILRASLFRIKIEQGVIEDWVSTLGGTCYHQNP